MAPSICFLLFSLLFLSPSTRGGDLRHHEEGFISLVISDKGLDFAKDFLIQQAVASIVASKLPEIEKTVQVPLVGKAKVVLSDITINDIQVNSSAVKTGETGIVVAVSGATADLSLKWRYSVSSWLVPIGISDSGTATVKVNDLQVGLTVNIRNQKGTLKLILLDYGCQVGDLSIKLHGGAAWLYQVLVDAFAGNIATAVEEAISKKIKEGISTLDYLLQSLPKTIALDETASLNISFVDNPVLSDFAIELDINGLFTGRMLVDAFAGNTATAVEEAISKKIKEGISTLDYLLQSLPKTIALDETASLNISFVDNPVLSDFAIELDINGLFTGRNEVLVPRGYHRGSNISVSYGDHSPKMITISLHENVFKSGSLVYFNADSMKWIVDELPDQDLLNTAEWRFLIPQLYKQYPNDDMNLNISISSPPDIQVTNKDVGVNIFIDIIIDVLEAGEVIPVACISVDFSASCAVEIVGNNLAGRLKLRKFSTNLKWSKIGKLHLNLIQSVTSTILKTVLIPYLNSQLMKGIPLPILSDFFLENAQILYAPPWISVCSDVSFLGDYYLKH